MFRKECGSCRKTFECTGVCKRNLKISAISGCYCPECYLKFFGEDKGWKSLRHKCCNYRGGEWRIA